jgi:hypothetical protein
MFGDLLQLFHHTFEPSKPVVVIDLGAAKRVGREPVF